MYNFVPSTPVDLTATVHAVNAVVVTGGTVTLKNGGASGTPVLALTGTATQSAVFTPNRPILFGKGLYIDPGAGASGTVVQG